MDKKDPKIFETTNVDVATFLMMEGIQLRECRKSSDNPKVVVFSFNNEKLNCLDLERTYLQSTFKKFRDINKYLLSQVFETLREK